MTRAIPFHDSLYRLAQVGDAMGVQLVRITELLADNRYTAVPVEFAEVMARALARSMRTRRQLFDF